MARIRERSLNNELPWNNFYCRDCDPVDDGRAVGSQRLVTPMGGDNVLYVVRRRRLTPPDRDRRSLKFRHEEYRRALNGSKFHRGLIGPFGKVPILRS